MQSCAPHATGIFLPVVGPPTVPAQLSAAAVHCRSRNLPFSRVTGQQTYYIPCPTGTPTKAALRAALARFDNRPPPGGGFKRRGPKPPPLSFQGDRILKERGKFEIPLSLSGVLWLLSFDMERQLTPQIFDLAGGSYAQLSSLRPQAQHLPAAGAAKPFLHRGQKSLAAGAAKLP